MNNPNNTKTRSLVFLVSAFAWSGSQAVTPVLDRHAYQLTSDISIDLVNKIISFNSNMLNCEQANGSPPLDTADFALHSNSQFIGLNNFSYRTKTNQLWMTSETNDVLCTNGQFIDEVFSGDFEALTQIQ